jgi:hypothetical protein
MVNHSDTAADAPSERGHEPTIQSERIALIWGTALAGLIFFALLVTWGLWQWMSAGGPQEVAPLAATPPEVEGLLTGQAPLNPNQPATRHEYEQRQHALLTEYAWVDRQTQIARIPIERAMEIMVEREGGQ